MYIFRDLIWYVWQMSKPKDIVDITGRYNPEKCVHIIIWKSITPMKKSLLCFFERTVNNLSYLTCHTEKVHAGRPPFYVW